MEVEEDKQHYTLCLGYNRLEWVHIVSVLCTFSDRLLLSNQNNSYLQCYPSTSTSTWPCSTTSYLYCPFSQRHSVILVYTGVNRKSLYIYLFWGYSRPVITYMYTSISECSSSTFHSKTKFNSSAKMTHAQTAMSYIT